jgi:tetraprenyl-beta-curcumene synthase
LSEGSDAPLRRDLIRTLRIMFRTPTRLRRLFAFGPSGWAHIVRYLVAVVPYANKRLAEIRRDAATIPDAALREQALASIDAKAYHVQGGSILATFFDAQRARRYIDIIAPLETIYDYLDNLCDRLDGVPERAYATLHEALLDAVDPDRPLTHYYRDGPHRDDGGYLLRLVRQTRERLTRLPAFDAVRDRLVDVAGYYAQLQTFKHLPADEREDACRRWYAENSERFPGMEWWEFAAACGSSLPVFAMIFEASHPRPRAADVGATFHAYFPYVSAVHILLDYFIDQAEDREHGELNFVAAYPSLEAATRRMQTLIARASARLRALPDGDRHGFLFNAMCLFYLTHPKVFEQHLDAQSIQLLSALG